MTDEKETGKPSRIELPPSPVPEGVVAARDIEYGRVGERPLLLNLYWAEGRPSDDLPVVAWVHGGGWAIGSKDLCTAFSLAPRPGSRSPASAIVCATKRCGRHRFTTARRRSDGSAHTVPSTA